MALDPLSDTDLSLLLQETSALYDNNSVEHAKAIFKQNAAPAALVITKIALQDGDSKVRLAAARYVTERNLGTLGSKTESGSAINELYQQIVENSLSD